MTKRPRTPAYFAVARGIADHPFFNYGRKPFSWREAWEWMIEQAAWKPKGYRHVRGIIDLQRGELAATHREMAAAWRWPRSNVTYFLRRLIAEGMIRAESRADTRGVRRRITICNYDKFQVAGRGVAQTVAQTDARAAPQLPGFAPEIPAVNSETVENLKNLRGRQESLGTSLPSVNYGDRRCRDREKTKPRHGQRSHDRRFTWFDYGSPEWAEAEAWDREHRNVQTFPVVYACGGKGNWFKARTLAEWHEWGKHRLAAKR